MYKRQPTFGGNGMIPAGINLTTKVYDATSVVKQIDSEESEVNTGYYEISESNLLASDSKSVFIGNTCLLYTSLVLHKQLARMVLGICRYKVMEQVILFLELSLIHILLCDKWACNLLPHRGARPQAEPYKLHHYYY